VIDGGTELPESALPLRRFLGNRSGCVLAEKCQSGNVVPVLKLACLPMNAIAYLCSVICVFILCAVVLPPGTRGQESAGSLGQFAGSLDVGTCSRPGSAVYHPTSHEYVVAGGGANMWFTNDAFHFLWKQASGDTTLSAKIAFVGSGGNAHRKACLLVRQSLNPESAYADAALHGDGLTSLQYRETAGARTYEIQASISAPQFLRIEKLGNYVSISHSSDGKAWSPAGGNFRLKLQDPYYVGLGVCSHDDAAIEKAAFLEVQINPGNPEVRKPQLFSALETVTIASKDRRAVYVTTNHIEAPNWSPDGAFFLFNSGGRIYQMPATGGEPRMIDTGFANRCNNDHGLSPDGTQLVISDQSQEKRSLIYTLPVKGGTPRRVTRLGPSYWHGWSPDGRTLTYCAERNGEFDIYSIPAAGGDEIRLTTAPGLDDGPEYSPDGRFIYFNSERTGSMQIWRMRPDGADQEQVTSDDFNNWFPHPSPDGRWIVFLSYNKDVKGHPENQDVALRLLPLNGGNPEVLAKLFGGQGTINVPSWSPDSKKIAFVSYQLR
jgi:regulation of enolase protein 1 (concanavalin A-like superfamily)